MPHRRESEGLLKDPMSMASPRCHFDSCNASWCAFALNGASGVPTLLSQQFRWK